MIKYQHLPKNILELLPKAADYLESHPKVLFAYLFGGLAKGKHQPLSDVDLALYLATSRSFSDIKLDIIGNLIKILQTDEIDLVVLNAADLPLQMNVLKTKKIIVDKDPFARHKFESLTMRRYFDFSKIESAILHRRYLKGRDCQFYKI
jgi:predicted nucleotidyltransferase